MTFPTTGLTGSKRPRDLKEEKRKQFQENSSENSPSNSAASSNSRKKRKQLQYRPKSCLFYKGSIPVTAHWFGTIRYRKLHCTCANSSNLHQKRSTGKAEREREAPTCATHEKQAVAYIALHCTRKSPLDLGVVRTT